jgi:CubicO group peptidase (beta-lactamase class C family)
VAVTRGDYWPTKGWRASNPEAQGLNSATLAGIHQFGRQTKPPVNGYVVTRHRYIVYEEYFRGYHSGSYNSVNSVTKSIISILVGVAITKGLIASLDEPIFDILSDAPLDDDRKHRITIRHLLTMTSGFSRDSVDRAWPMHVQDPLGVISSRPLDHDPGSHFFYDDSAVHLLSIMLTRLTGLSAAQFAFTELFEPLGIWTDPSSRFLWRTDPDGPHTFHQSATGWPDDGLLWNCDRAGHSVAPYGVHLTVRDMAKLGVLYLNRGCWDGRQIVDPGYMEESTRQHSRGGSPGGSPYGFLWWMASDGGPDYVALGFGSQMIRVLPKEDIVIACTTTPTRDPMDVTGRFVRPAILDQ